MNPSTQMAVLEDVTACLEGVGVPKLVVFNGHGGNDFRQMLRELQARHPRIHLSLVNWFHIDSGADIFAIVGDHADERETSLMLHLHPNLVLPQDEWGEGRDNLPRLKAMREKWAWAQRPWTQATNDTGSGDPRQATAEKGRAYFDRLASRFASYLIELAAADASQLYQKT
jgi:creatinine amidohydrolase